ncbi:MAG: integration host factor subunit alpha [bacterium]
MTKEDIVKKVWTEGNFTNRQAREIVETVLSTIKHVLARGEEVELRGFGKFVVRQKNTRVGRNPRTGQEAEISARRVVTFKPSKILRDQIH